MMTNVYIGIDFGGTKIAGGVVKDGKIIKRHQVPTRANEGKAIVLSQLREVISVLSKGSKIKGIGIGVPGLFKGTKILLLPNVQALNGVDVKKALRLTVPVVLENDARCFALAEANFGAARGKKNVLGVILGTGVGGGVVIEGRAYRGANESAGEIGHMIHEISLNKFSPLDKHGDWESLLSGPSMIRRNIERGGKEDHPATIWNAESEEAKATKEEWLRHVTIFFASLQYAFDPEAIVVGGGLSNIDFYPEVNKRLKDYGARSIVKKGKLQVDAAILGSVVALNS